MNHVFSAWSSHSKSSLPPDTPIYIGREAFILQGSLHLSGQRHNPNTNLEFSHLALEVRTSGRLGRFSRENPGCPSYIDFASTPTQHIDAKRVARTRTKSQIAFSPRQTGADGAIHYEFTIGIPTHLFSVIRTRQLLLSAKAVFVELRQGYHDGIWGTEIVDAYPSTISVSYLSLAKDTLVG